VLLVWFLSSSSLELLCSCLRSSNISWKFIKVMEQVSKLTLLKSLELNTRFCMVRTQMPQRWDPSNGSTGSASLFQQLSSVLIYWLPLSVTSMIRFRLLKNPPTSDKSSRWSSRFLSCSRPLVDNPGSAAFQRLLMVVSLCTFTSSSMRLMLLKVEMLLGVERSRFWLTSKKLSSTKLARPEKTSDPSCHLRMKWKRWLKLSFIN